MIIYFNGDYTGKFLDRVSFPIGGIGAGMFCMDGTGSISHLSINNKPEIFNEPFSFAAISVKGVKDGAKVLEAQVPEWKMFGPPGSGNGGAGRNYGLPVSKTDDFFHVSHLPPCRLKIKIFPLLLKLRDGALLFLLMLIIPAFRLEPWSINLKTIPLVR